MSRYAPVLWLALWPQIVVALPGVEQPVEGFARLVWASNEGEYGSNRGTQVASSWEYAQDGTQAVVWESAPVPQGYTRGFVTFAWSCGLARQEEAHGLYLNDVKILSFNSGLMVKPTSWEEGDFALRFEPVMKDAAGDVHGVMYLRVPAATVHSGKPVVLKVGGTEGGGSWFMLHHFEDTYAQAQSILALPSGRRLVIAPPRTLFLAPGQIG